MSKSDQNQQRKPMTKWIKSKLTWHLHPVLEKVPIDAIASRSYIEKEQYKTMSESKDIQIAALEKERDHYKSAYETEKRNRDADKQKHRRNLNLVKHELLTLERDIKCSLPWILAELAYSVFKLTRFFRYRYIKKLLYGEE